MITTIYNEETISKEINTKWAGKTVHFAKETDSTNEWCKRMSKENAEHGTLAVAEFQSAGKGRLGRKWTAPEGSSVMMSILLKPEFEPQYASMLTLVMGLSVAQAVCELGVEVSIKWPNDVVVSHKKICGILTEMGVQDGKIREVVIGVGLNVNLKEIQDELKDKATSLYLETGKTYDRNRLIGLVMEKFEINYEKFVQTCDLSMMLDDYNMLLANKSQPVRVLDKISPYEGVALEIDKDGALLVRVQSGEIRKVCSGEVSVRTASNIRFQLQAELTRIQNRISRWFNIYFPEYKTVYGKPDAKSGMLILKAAPLPEDILTLGIDGVNQIWRDAKLRAVGKARAKTLIEAAEHSVGSKEGAVSARMEIRMLLEDYESRNTRLQEVMVLIEELVRKIPMAEKLLEIKGVGIRTVSGFLAEVGDISRFSNPKELQKLAGLALVENSSGKHKGETTISRRGRKRLRYLLFEVAMSLVAKNPEFRELHNYYTTRKLNPLKKMQSLMAVAAKLIRDFYAMLTKGVAYDPQKLVSDIRRPAAYLQVA